MDLVRPAQTAMAQAGIQFKILDRQELTDRLPGFIAGDITQGVLGLNCGILNPNQLTGFYEQNSHRLGARFAYSLEVTGFTRDSQSQINGIVAGQRHIKAPTIIVATGAWMGLTMALAGLEVPVTPEKTTVILHLRPGTSVPAFPYPWIQRPRFAPLYDPAGRGLCQTVYRLFPPGICQSGPAP